jgi:hypothetical protein
LPRVAEKQHRQSIVRLRQVGLGLTLNHIRRFAVHICKHHSVQSPRKGEWWERGCLPSEKEPRRNSVESGKSQLLPT